MKTAGKIRIVIFASMLVFAIISIYVLNKKGDKNYLEKHCKGIIKGIYFDGYNLGFPTLKIDSELYRFGVKEEKVQHYIKVGDSIVKEKGYKTIKLYHKNEKGIWIEKIFK